jgi:hypothetical protein
VRGRALVVLGALALSACSALGGDPPLDYAQQVIDRARIGPSELSVVGGIDHRNLVYRPGQKIRLTVSVSRDAYVAVLRVLANGVTTLVFPNRYQTSARLAANTVLEIPGAGDPFTITAGKPGPELFKFVATTNGGSWLFSTKPEPGATFAELGSTTRALAKQISDSLGTTGGAKAAAAALVVRVEN